jgi:hypothetical protein
MSLSTLTPFRATTPSLKEHAPAPAATRDEMNSRNGQPGQNSNLPVERTTRVDASGRLGVEQLTVEEGRSLSIETVNLLVKENPALVARLIIDAGRRARGELPTTTASLHPTARAIVLAGERARGRQLSDADAEFLSAYVEEHWPS